MSRRAWFTLLTLIGIVTATSCSVEPASITPTADMPNPASVFCEENGGKLELRQDASGGMTGICVFTDGSECEEWAYFRGECQPQSAVVTPEPDSTAANMPNPASVFCEENGGKLEFRQDASGGTVGICVFADGSECEEWAYFRGECQPQSAVTSEPMPTATAELGSDGWKIYRNEALGYLLHYPPDATIESADDIMETADDLKTITIVGPLTDGEYWPMIYFNHPGDREEYRPPEGVDLAQWLTDHNLLVEARQPDGQIAGTTAIHTRHDRSPQSYAFDTFYFARMGQLYSVVILHTGDKEDWEVYNHFLSNIQFTP